MLISGQESAKHQAAQILEALWHKLQQGQEVDSQTVDSAIRFLQNRNTDTLHPDENGGLHNFTETQVQIKTKKKKIQPRSPLQAGYIKAMHDHNLVFGIGPAGTGKTYLAVAMAVQMLEEGRIERILLTRPAVEAGERLGFLPGEMKEKMDPYMRPLYDALHDTMAVEKVQKMMATEEIEIAPLAFMRGRTLSNSFIILDEAQNTTEQQMLMFLTRMGERSHMVVTGDPSQIDLPSNVNSGLVQAERILRNESEMSFIHFTSKDVVRHRLVTKIINAYDRHKAHKATPVE